MRDILLDVDAFGETIMFITLDNDNPSENERIEDIMSLPRFSKKDTHMMVFSLNDLLYMEMYGGMEEQLFANAAAVVCMEGVLRRERSFISDLQRFCVGYAIPMYFEDILKIELRKRRRK